MSFFRSRWVERPEHVTELEPDALPRCFCSGAVAAGIKPQGLDVGVLVSFDESASAARFTTNARLGAPVIASKEARLGGLRAIVANSGCANVGDGERFVELTDRPPGVRDVRDTNICRVHATGEPTTGRVLAFAAIDNLWKGAAGQAEQDLNLMLGLDEKEWLT